MRKKLKITDESTLNTPLELCLKLQYRSSRKIIQKTDFKLQKPIDRVFYDDINQEDQDKSRTIDVAVSPAHYRKVDYKASQMLGLNNKIISCTLKKNFTKINEKSIIVLQ